jgi:hypothetical protein
MRLLTSSFLAVLLGSAGLVDGAMSSASIPLPSTTTSGSASTVLKSPSRVSATAIGQSSVALSWRAPSTAGTAQVNDYGIEFSTDRGVTWVALEPDPISTRTSETVRGLVPGLQYLFRVSARSSGGQSAPAVSSSVTVVGSFLAETPLVTGSAVLGQTLTASISGWVPEPTTVSYQWLRDGVPISSRATLPTYKLTSSDVGRQISVRVTGSRAGYVRASVISASTTSVSRSVSFPAPEIVGNPFVGATLTAAVPVWNPQPNGFSWSWFRDGNPILGATNETYVLTLADSGARISVQLTGTFPDAAAKSVVSDQTATVQGGSTFESVSPPALLGDAILDETLTASISGWVPEPTTVSYQWLRDGYLISGASRQAYKLTSSDVGRQISVRVTGLSENYFPETHESNEVRVSPRLRFDAKSLSVDTNQCVRDWPATRLVWNTWGALGQTLTASISGWVPEPTTVSYQWLRDGYLISGASRQAYKLTSSDVGRQISVRVTGSRAGYVPETLECAMKEEVIQGYHWSRSSPPIVSGRPSLGQTLTASISGWVPEPTTVSYQWLRNGVPISVGATYTTTKSDVGWFISVRVTGSKETFLSRSETSKGVQVSRR